jgi:DNA-binding protein H-NS
MNAEIDLDTLSLQELKQLHSQVGGLIASYEVTRRKEAVAKLEALARELGYSLAELAGAETKRPRSGAKSKSTGAPKYANPEDPSQTWSGKGRRPAWMTAALEAGTPLEAIKL